MISTVLSSPINESTAYDVAENFFYYKNDRTQTEFSISEIETYTNNESNIFYIFKLEPSGFILISADNFIKPVLAYSFENNYVSDNIPDNINYIFNLYSSQLFEQIELRDNPDSEILEEFSKETKPRNFAYSMSIDLIRNWLLN